MDKQIQNLNAILSTLNNNSKQLADGFSKLKHEDHSVLNYINKLDVVEGN